ncbi:hypothetical protein PVAP13_5NG134881 [Panicum virgatum]|uniref:Uncharacterized protein n=1 Tax=Panicum virgatum TaxID=38727 RepID=A0A8T0RS15_PANVG|nr:hypothetical protein PVAP13_5NG134881 [Panicum virgatum]
MAQPPPPPPPGAAKSYLVYDQYDGGSEISKKFSKSLLKKLKKIAEDGGCIDDFTEGHIRVFPSGKNLFMDNGILCVPNDIHQLLEIMMTNFGAHEFFSEHASLTPLVLPPAVFKYMHDLLQINISAEEYHTICCAVIAVMGGADWRDGVNQNYLLSETFYFKGGSDYEVPYSTSNQRGLTTAQKAALYSAGLTSQKLMGLTPYEIKVIDSHQLLTFLRNRIAHQMEAIAAGLSTWNSVDLYDFSLLHSELVTLVHFHSVFSTIQHHLYQMGYLPIVDLL